MIGERLTGLLGVPVERVTDLGTGHEWTLHRAALADGREVFAKVAAGRPGALAAEAYGLRWLAAGAPDLVPRQSSYDENPRGHRDAGLLMLPVKGRPLSGLRPAVGCPRVDRRRAPRGQANARGRRL